MRTFRKIAQPYFAAKAEEAKNGGGAEGVKVVSELPETGKDGDLVLVKKEADIDISNVEFDVYTIIGSEDKDELMLVDKNEVYSDMNVLNQAIRTYIGDLTKNISDNVFYDAPQAALLTMFQEAYEQGMFEIVQNKEEIIGKTCRKPYLIKQGTCKLGELNFVELDDSDSHAYEEAKLYFIYGNKTNGFATDITIGETDVTEVQYMINIEDDVVIGFDTDLELRYKLIRTLNRGEVFDFSVDAEQTYNWMNEAQLEGFDSIAMNGGFVVKEPEYDYNMYVYYDGKFNEIPSGEEAQSFEDYTFLAAGNFAGTYNSSSIKFKGTDALINYLEKKRC